MNVRMPSIINDKSIKCVVHGFSTQEKERVASKKFKVLDCHDGGLQCQKCKRYTCNVCIKGFVDLLNNKLSSIQYELVMFFNIENFN